MTLDPITVTSRRLAAAPEALIKGIQEFNSWRFYDCHETLEDVWRETGSKGEGGTLADFYQGIIKVAAGFHHLLRANHKGAVNLLSDALRLLEPFRPRCLGVDVQRLIGEARACLDGILELGPDRLSQFDRSLIPVIHFDRNEPEVPCASAGEAPHEAESVGLRSGFVQANDVRLHYLKWGDPGRPPLLLLHATGFLARLWPPVAERLAASPPAGRQGFHVYAYDSRGHGDSDKPARDYHWQRFVDDLQGFIEAFSLQETAVAGHSAGAAATAYLAATKPEYVSRLVLIEPIILPGHLTPSSERRLELAESARRRRMVWPSAETMVQALRSRPAFARWREDILRLYAEHGTFRREDGHVELKCPGRIEAQVFENSGSLNVWEVLPQIACPTLVMRGELTDQYLSLVAEGSADRIPNARLVTIEGAGHLAPMERPEAVADKLLRFLEETS